MTYRPTKLPPPPKTPRPLPPAPETTFINGEPIKGDQLLAYIRERTDTIILSFSAGKDSISAWLRTREHFKVIPVFMWLIPNLRIDEDALKQYEHQFDTPIIRMPSPSFMRQINNQLFQPPERQEIIAAANLPDLTYDDVFQAVMEAYNIPDHAWVATGVRAADSPNRRATINKYGPTSPNRVPPVFYPVWDQLKDELIHELKQANILLPDQYRLYSRSFDGIDLRFIYPLREHYPDDYQRILDWFPLADLEIFRYEAHLEHKRLGWY